MTYDEILDLVDENNLEVLEIDAPEKIKGLLMDEYIIINKNLSQTEKKCVLAEKLAHYKLNYGNILNQRDMNNRKQEQKARSHSYRLLVPMDRLVDALRNGCTNLYEIADFMDVPFNILNSTLEYYKRRYGKYIEISPKYTIYFDPA